MALELWQVPVVIAAVVLVVIYTVAQVVPTGSSSKHQSETAPDSSVRAMSARDSRLLRRAAKVRTNVLVLLSVVLLGLLIVSFDRWELSSVAANIAVVASLTIEGFTLWLTYLSYQDQRRLLSHHDQRPQQVSTPQPSADDNS